ncbi:MAG TPA: SDR family oxidoreductase [Armatimonadota bacterium]|nr:SDR family oxidoreductase [Armatimonadota bacterium]
MRFESKTIVVTGGAMGIGRATVQRLASEGARVIIADIDENAAQATIEALGDCSGSGVFNPVDLSDPESIAQFAERVGQMTPELHGLVNNCGIAHTCPISETGDDDWEPQVTINLRAPVLLAKHLLPLLKAGPGHIVNVSSEAGFKARSGSWVYDATKSGICAVTRTMAAEFVGFGMRANTVAPGWTVTEMHFGGAPDPAARKREMEEISDAGGLIPRLARPEEIAAGIVFLLSDDASYITATTLHVDGGRIGR